MFSPASLTVKNYRCFPDSKPLRLDVRDGFTAFVGPNNSGKSTILKFFYELRHAFRAVSNHAGNVSTQFASMVADPTSIFCDYNARDLQIEIAADAELAIQPQIVTDVALTVTRSTPPGVAASYTIRHPQAQFGLLKRIFDAFGSAFYIGPFRNIINETATSYYDIEIGSAFVSTWNKWKTGTHRQQNTAMVSVADDIKRIFGLNRLEINASADLKTLHVIVNNRPYRLEEQGSGLAQFIVTMANVAIHRPSIVLIDEPELNLHPSLQVDFLTSLASYATGPVFFSTHSIGLARSVAERIYFVKSTADGSECEPMETTRHYAALLGELSYSSLNALGFEQILLVEGPTEVRTMQQFLRKIQKDHRIVLVPLGGSSLIHGGAEPELAEIQRLCPRVSAIIDSERSAYGAPVGGDRLGFERCCKNLNIPVLLTSKRATENYFSERALRTALNNTACKALGDWDLLRSAVPTWSKSDNWRIAREMHWSELEPTDLGQFLKNL